jgi:phosphatidate phosphatase PAH1
MVCGLHPATAMRRPWPLDLPVLAFAVLVPLGACALHDSADAGDPPGDGDGSGDDPGSDDPDGPGSEPVAFATCTSLPYTPGEPQGFEHVGNQIVAAGGGPTHHAQDVVAGADQAATVSAVFQYSALAVDIADEVVKISLDTCDGWRTLGEVRTDGDGRATAEVGDPLAPGVYHLVYEVAADATVASAYLWSLPGGTHLALFDIDGTLTTADTELWKEILLGDYVPEAYPSAATLTGAHAARGHIPIYLTGRPSTLNATTRAWLDELEFAHGIVRVTDSGSGALPTDSGVGAFKRDFIRSLTDAGLTIDLAYGNASTDIFAYLSAGLPADQVWIIGTHAGEEGTQAVHDSWTARAAEVASGPPIEQPFSR